MVGFCGFFFLFFFVIKCSNLDPEERNNLYNSSDTKRTELLQLVQQVKDSQYMAPQSNKFHPLGIPELHEGVWKPYELL